MMQRANKEIEHVVNQGLMMINLTQADVSSVARVLSHKGVPRDVIARVFFYPKVHRSYHLDAGSPAHSNQSLIN